MADFFLSYRAATAAAKAGRIYDRLVAKFGKNTIFFDRGVLSPGVDWKIKLQSELEEAIALLAVVDAGWAQSFAARIEEPYYVRFEIETSLRLKTPIVPILVDNCPLPKDSELPPTIRPLLDLQFIPLDDRTSDLYQTGIDSIAKALASCPGYLAKQEALVLRHLEGQKYSAARGLLEATGHFPEAGPRHCCYLALARLEGRSFNSLYPSERETIEMLLRESRELDRSWALPAILLAILEIDFYQLNGQKSRKPVHPTDALALRPTESDLRLLTQITISRSAKQRLHLNL